MPRIVLISGSTRAASSNSALLRTAVAVTEPGTDAVFADDALGALPHFNPDDDHDPLPPTVAALRREVADADAVLICTPEYAGTLPGSMKNLLDWLVGGTEITGKPVAWVNAAADPRRGHGAIATLETVLGYVQADLVRDACVSVPVPPGSIGTDGLISDAGVRTAVRSVLATLAGHLR